MTTSPKNTSFVKAGFVRKAHGVKGEVLLSLDAGYWPPSAGAVYLKKRSKVRSGQNILFDKKDLKAWPVLSARSSALGVIVQLKGLENRNSAQAEAGCEVYLQSCHFQSKKGESFYLSELLGFRVYQSEQQLGFIDHFLSHSHQDLLAVKSLSQEIIEIPFVSAYIESVDFNKKTLKLKLPPCFPGLK